VELQLLRLAERRQHGHAQHAADFPLEPRSRPDVAERIGLRILPERPVEVVRRRVPPLEIGLADHLAQDGAAVLSLILDVHLASPFALGPAHVLAVRGRPPSAEQATALRPGQVASPAVDGSGIDNAGSVNR